MVYVSYIEEVNDSSQVRNINDRHMMWPEQVGFFREQPFLSERKCSVRSKTTGTDTVLVEWQPCWMYRFSLFLNSSFGNAWAFLKLVVVMMKANSGSILLWWWLESDMEPNPNL